jgi:hypothetical protein
MHGGAASLREAEFAVAWRVIGDRQGDGWRARDNGCGGFFVEGFFDLSPDPVIG